ncbi:MAG: flagella basal body P-ring formation protein FlgA [Bacilli bacterium]
MAAAVSQAPLGAGPECVRLLRPVGAGEAVTVADVEPAACAIANPQRPFRMDARWGVAIAARRLTPGEVVSAPAASTLAAVRTGDVLFVSARAGPVTVERRVEAVQPARAGEPVFVRGDDGRVFRAPAPELAP